MVRRLLIRHPETALGLASTAFLLVFGAVWVWATFWRG